MGDLHPIVSDFQPQDIRQQKIVNSARSMHALCSQASLYVTMADPPTRVPESISLDGQSEWHTSALLCTAMETMTLPSRLKARNGLSSTLTELEDFLKSNGNQTIAKLDLEVGNPLGQDGHTQEHRDKSFASSQTAGEFQAQYERLVDLESNTKFALSPSLGEYGRTRSRNKPSHVFSRADVIRNEKISADMLTNGEVLSVHPQEIPGPARLQK